MRLLADLDRGINGLEGVRRMRDVRRRTLADIEQEKEAERERLFPSVKRPAAAPSPQAIVSKQRAELRASLAWHRQALKFYDSQNGVQFKKDATTGDSFDVGPLRAQLDELLPLAQKRDASGYNPTPDAQEARKKYEAIKSQYDAIRQKRQRIIEETNRVQAAHDEVEKQYGTARFGAAFDDEPAAAPAPAREPAPTQFSMPTGDDWASQRIRAVNTERRRQGQPEINPEHFGIKVQPIAAAAPAALAAAAPQTLEAETMEPGEAPAAPEKSRIANALKSFVQGAAEVPAGALDWVAITANKLDRIVPEWMKSGDGKDPDELLTAKLAKTIREEVAKVAPTDPELAKEFWAGEVPKALGNMIGFMTPSAIIKGAWSKFVVPAVLGATVGGSGGYREAKQRGATDEQAELAGDLNTLVGTSEAVPISRMLNRLNKGTGGKLKQVIADAGVEGAEEFIQEFFQTTAGNVIAKEIYDENQEVFEGALRSGQVGGVSGVITSLLVSALGRKKRGRDLGDGQTAADDTIYRTAEEAERGAAPDAPESDVVEVDPDLRAEIEAEAAAQGAGDGAPEADSSDVTVPLMITRQMARDLRGLGYSIADINRMTPKEAWATLEAKASKAPPGEAQSQAGMVDQQATPEAVAPDPATPAPTSKPATPETLAGEQIDGEWSAFGEESGSLKVPRAEMPQIKAEHRGALTQFLLGRDIPHESTEVLPGELKPTQAEFSPAKVEKARKFTGGDRAILVSSDNHVVDGHHQWMAKLKDAPDDYMRVIRLDAPISELLEQVREFPSAESSEGATSTPDGQKEMPTETAQAAVGGDPAAASVPPEAAATPPEADKLPYEEFSKRYRQAFENSNKYTPDQVGSQRFTDEMAALADENPGHLERFEAEAESAAKAKPPAAPKPPAVASGTNKPEVFIRAISKASGITGESTAARFLRDFAPRLHRANRTAFEAMEVHVLNQKEWTAHENVGQMTQDSAAAYNPETNVMFFNSDKMADPETAVSSVVHEMGHFAEKFALGEDFTQREWQKLTEAQRLDARRAYNDDRADSEMLRRATVNDRRARAEWAAMQFARVVKGDTDGMSAPMIARLKKFLQMARDLVTKWVGAKNLTTKELDAKILEMLGYAEKNAEKHRLVGQNSNGLNVYEDARGARHFEKVPDILVSETVGLVPSRKPGGGIEYLPEIRTAEQRANTEFETTQEKEARTQKKPAAAADSPPLAALKDNVTGAITRGEKKPIVEKPAQTSVSKPLPEGWKDADVREILERVEKGEKILLGTNKIGMPDIQTVKGAKHIGMGMFTATTPEYEVSFDGGGAMAKTTASNKGYTRVSEERGSFPYDFEAIKANLRSYLTPKNTLQGSSAAERLTHNQEVAGSNPAPAPKSPLPNRDSVLPEQKPAKSKADELADKLFDGLLGTPPVEIKQEGFPRDRRQMASDLAETLIDDKVATPEALAAWLDAKYKQKARKFSQALWSQLVSLEPSLPAAPDWNGVYGAIDNSRPAISNPSTNEPVDAKPPAVESRPEGSGDRGKLGGEQSTAGGKLGEGRKPDATGEGSERPGSGSDTAGAGGRDNSSGKPRDLRDVRGSGAEGVASQNFRISDADRIGIGGLKTKYADNIAAIRVLKAVEAENRQATAKEQAILVRYVGWGGLKSVFDPNSAGWAKEHNELKSLLTPDEFTAARASVLNAHYTSPTVVRRGVYAALKRFGFRGGRMVEGGVGIGHFIGMMPDEMVRGTSYVGVEKDTTTAKIAQLLYPEAKIYSMGFEDANLVPGSFDASAGNPPFGETKLFDKNFPEASKHSIHNYFILKQLELLRPGGVAGFVVSHYFLDAKNPTAREAVSKRADFLGAIRLPNTAFKQNANTEVTTDIVFFQKRPQGEKSASEQWTSVVQIKDEKTGEPITINSWLAARPEMMLGKMTLEGSMYAGRNEATLIPLADQDLGTDLDAAVAKLPENIYEQADRKTKQRLTTPEPISVPPGTRVGAFFVDGNGAIRRRTHDSGMEQQHAIVEGLADGSAERIKGIIKVRDAMNRLVNAEMASDSTEAQMNELRRRLNAQYDQFVAKHGYLNSQTNRRVFYDDPEAARVLGLERDYNPGVSEGAARSARKRVADAKTSEEIEKAKHYSTEARPPSAEKAAIFTKRVNQPYTEITSVETPQEALAVSLNQRGFADVEYMSELTGQDRDVIISGLKGLIFNTPGGEWQGKDQYLSGNVRKKLNEAKRALEKTKDPKWKENIEALEAVLPKDVSAVDIAVPAGAPWVPASDVATFARELTGANPSAVVYRKSDGGWLFNHDDRSIGSTEKWGTNDAPFGVLMGDILNGKPTVITRVSEKDGKREVHAEATALAAAKAEEIKTKWGEWIFSDQERRERLTRFYNDNFNNYVDPNYDGSHLTLPGVSTQINLLRHQKNVIWRTITDMNVLYDHVVGAGKTFAGVASFMELRRMGRVRKPLFIVPNHLTSQWRDAFVQLYPNANVLAASPNDFTKDNRQKLFAKILTGEYDAVVIGHSQAKKIGVKPEIEKAMLNEMIAEISATIEAMKKAEGKRGGNSRAVAQAEKTRERITTRLRALAETGERDAVATFEELGIDGLFVDEAHEFKNLFYTTQMQRVAGLGSPEGSQKAFDLYMKTRYMKKHFGGKAPVVFATGTPISNSLVEMFTMQRYLQPDVLEEMGLKTLDAWAKVFASVEHVYEVDPTGTGYRMATRLANFQNVGELAATYRTVADVITSADLQQQAEAEGRRFPTPKVNGGKPNNIVAERTREQAEYFGIPQPHFDHWAKYGHGSEAEAIANGWIPGQPLLDPDGNPVESYKPGTILYRIDNMPDDPRVDNMLKLTSDARKAGLDMRLVDPRMPDRPESKVNRAVADIVKIHQQWAEDKGTQLVFCDLSVPASARGKATSRAKEQAADFTFIRNGRGDIIPVDDAKPVKLSGQWAKQHAFFVRKSDAGGWAVSERSSGRKVAGAATRSAAILEAESVIERFGERFIASVAEAIPPLEQVTEAREQWLATRKKEDPKDDDGIASAEGEGEGEGGVSVDELLADQSKFSVYDDMKAKLIAAGIPEREIAFIHDYDTTEKKAKLFAAVNRGDVRVLFGSTPKMGAGTNVQKRIVALHHMDAPWRPSDLEQREGRAIRQGNMLYERSLAGYATPRDYDADPESFAVTINRYATNQTYDTRMWQLIEHKARGIEGFRKADRSTRKLEDVSGEAANAGDMKAAASGDPAIQREMELRNERNKLEILKKAWSGNRHELERSIAYMEVAERRHASAVASAQRLIDAREPKPDPFEFTAADGAKLEKKEDLEAIVLGAVNLAYKGFNGDRPSTEGFAPLGRYRGYDFQVAIDKNWLGKTVINIEGRKPPTTALNTAWSTASTYGPEDVVNALGLVVRMDNWLNNFEAEIRSADATLAHEQRRREEAKAELAKPFPKEKQLAEIRAEHEEARQGLLNKKKRPPPKGGSTLGTPPDADEAAPRARKPAPVPGQPGDFFRSTPDSLIESGLDVARQIYTRRGQKTASQIAKEIVDAIGEDKAAALSLDPNDNGIPGDVKTILYGELLARKATRLADDKTTPEDRAKAQQEIQHLQATKPAYLTEKGQEISALQQVYKDVRAATMSEYLGSVKADQDNRLGESGKKAVDDATKAVNDAREDAIEEATKALDRAIRRRPVTKGIWKLYRENAASRLLAFVEDRFTPTPEQAPLQEFTSRIVAEMRARLAPSLPDKPDSGRPEPTAAELLREAIENKEKYADVLTSVRQKFAKEHAEGSPILDLIDTELANLGLMPYSKRLLDRAIKEAHRAMRTRLADLAKEHFTRTDASAGDLAAGIAAIAGVSEAESVKLAADLAERAKQLVADARKKALKKLRRQMTATARTRAVLNAVERAVQLNNLGALNESDLREIVAKRLGIPRVTAERMQKLAKLADKVATAENTATRAKAELELANTMRIYRGFGKADIATAVWYANLLSGYTTQMANTLGNIMQGALQMVTMVAANPGKGGIALRGWLAGLQEGGSDALSILKTGAGRRDFDAKVGVSGNVLELVDFSRDFPSLPKPVAKTLTATTKSVRMVFRAMKAVDALFYYPAKEAYTRVIVAKLLEADYSGAELRSKIRETLSIAPDAYLGAEQQATTEGFTGIDKALRVANLIEERRSGTEAGRTAVAAGEQFGLESTFNNTPVGWAGVMYHHLVQLTDGLRPGGMPVLKAFLPFLRVPTNIFNISLNYTPIGVARAYRGMVETRSSGSKTELARRHFNSDERARLLIQSLGGSVAMAALYMLATGGDDDGEEPWFTITATGPSDFRKANQLRATGWRDHAMKFGDVWISYKDSPLLIPLAVVGNLVDAHKYQKAKEDLTFQSRAVDSVMRSARTVFSTSMLSGLGTLMDFAQDRASADRVTAFLSRIPVDVAIPFSNLLRQIDRAFNPALRENDAPGGQVTAAVPFARNAGSVRTDVFGEPVESPVTNRFGGIETNDPLREVLRDKNVFISTPSRQTKLGNAVMTPEQHREYQRISGEAIRRRLDAMAFRFRNMTSEQVEREVDRITRQERERAKARLRVSGRNLSAVFDN
jgi:N12 class adenine-specific DNA methylase